MMSSVCVTVCFFKWFLTSVLGTAYASKLSTCNKTWSNLSIRNWQSRESIQAWRMKYKSESKAAEFVLDLVCLSLLLSQVKPTFLITCKSAMWEAVMYILVMYSTNPGGLEWQQILKEHVSKLNGWAVGLYMRGIIDVNYSSLLSRR